MRAFWAHTPDGTTPQNTGHLLADHLRAVTERTMYHVRYYQTDLENPAATADKYARLAAFMHDFGKYNLDFQLKRLQYDPRTGRRVTTSTSRLEHAGLGAWCVDLLLKRPPVQHKVVSHVISGHHAGLTSQMRFEERLSRTSIQFKDQLKDITQYAKTELPDLLQLSTPPHVPFKRPLSNEFFARMLLSALVDADYLDTEAYCNPQKTQERLGRTADMATLWQRLAEAQAEFVADTPLQQLRQQMYQEALAAATSKPGFYRLSMPTGGGKTRTSLAFALNHALQHGLRRVIYAIPYTSIIDQTAQVFRTILDRGAESNVLEHHSALELPNVEENSTNVEDVEATETARWLKLSSENWDAPVIVTTTVQLFESLLSCKVSKLRKIHNISGSVLILDEVQTLPVKLLKPIMDVLNELVKYYRVTVVFCTATQPAFDASAGLDLPELKNAKDIIVKPQYYFDQLQRVSYEIDLETPVSWHEVADKMQENKQVLCIVNTRQQARDLYDQLDNTDAVMLSTWLFPRHRKLLIKRIRRKLKAGLPCQVVSTQLIECGVDVDFPVVYRALGPLDAIVQAAGRCNREGKQNGLGKVWVFRPEENMVPKGDYAVKVNKSEHILAKNPNLDNPEIFYEYFRDVFNRVDQGTELQKMREKLDYPEVDQMFQMIDAAMVPVIIEKIRFKGRTFELREVQEMVTSLEVDMYFPEDLWQKLQQYSINIYRSQIQNWSMYLRRLHRTYTKHGKTKTIDLDMYVWTGIYDLEKGIVAEDDGSQFVF